MLVASSPQEKTKVRIIVFLIIDIVGAVLAAVDIGLSEFPRHPYILCCIYRMHARQNHDPHDTVLCLHIPVQVRGSSKRTVTF